MCCLLTPPIPVAAEEPLHKVPTITYTLIGVEAAIHLGVRIVVGLQNLEILPAETLVTIHSWLGYTPSKAYPWSFFTYAFLHGNLFHLIGNLLPLWLFGVFIEERLGRAKYLLLLVLATPAAVLGHEILVQSSGIPEERDLPLVGASGYLMGILGAFLVLMPLAKYRFIVIFWFVFIIRIWRFTLAAAVYLPIFVFWNDLYAVFAGSASNVAHGAHLGGAALGILLAGLVRFTPRTQRSVDRQLAVEREEQVRANELAHRNFSEALDRGAAHAALAIVRESEKAGHPLRLSLRDRVRLAEGLEKEGEAYLAGQTYRSLLAGDSLNREQRLEIGLRLAKILLHYERNIEATKELLRTLHREHQSDPRYPEIERLVEQVQEFERNLYKRPR